MDLYDMSGKPLSIKGAPPRQINLREPIAQTTLYRGGNTITVDTEFSRVDMSGGRSQTPQLFQTTVYGTAKNGKQVQLDVHHFSDRDIALAQHAWFTTDVRASNKLFGLLSSGKWTNQNQASGSSNQNQNASYTRRNKQSTSRRGSGRGSHASVTR